MHLSESRTKLFVGVVVLASIAAFIMMVMSHVPMVRIGPCVISVTGPVHKSSRVETERDEPRTPSNIKLVLRSPVGVLGRRL